LTEDERAILARVLSVDFSGASELRAQVGDAEVVGHWGPSSPSVYLRTPNTVAPAPTPDGPVPVRSFVLDRAGETMGELLLWVESGRLSALEYAWFTDEMPQRLPLVAQVRVERDG
jgi:hypothetical protein